MITGWLGLVLLIALLDWVAVWTENEKLNRFTKPATLIALLAWFSLTAGLSGKLLWFWLALFFGLLGDIFLLLPKRFFFTGLVAFLLGHGAYIVGLWLNPAQFRFPHGLIALVIMCVIGLVAPPILRNMHAESSARRLRLPVVIYMLVISSMVFLALSTLFRSDWRPLAAQLAAAGGVLFFSSDTMLAYREFVHPFPKARFWVRVTYHLAQIALAVAAVLNFTHKI
ncbi:MAG: lysoplasmalogenase [Chloroflexi bacterium]|nr:lysoplasmalogenase [Chloroflexota bacterium]